MHGIRLHAFVARAADAHAALEAREVEGKVVPTT